MANGENDEKYGEVIPTGDYSRLGTVREELVLYFEKKTNLVILNRRSNVERSTGKMALTTKLWKK